MNRNLSFLVLCSILACSNAEVEQIYVEVPNNVIVPPEMAYIPEGEFVMGSPDAPRTAKGRKVFVKAFLIDLFETSRGEYNLFQPNHPFNPKKKKFPISHVSYNDAKAFCKSKDKRLPTEAEWEKAARGPDGRKWPWKVYHQHPNNGFSGFLPEPVNKRQEWVSPYGLYGMGHNVWEWVSDWYYYQGMPEAKRKKLRVIRGGLTQTHLVIKFSPTWFRNYMRPNEKLNFIGFRCAKDS
tara:strand:- start:424 stop:1137 length:714 start_codon:yes stop_codon:yes gene_type:complete